MYGPVTVHDVTWQLYSFLVLDLTFWIVLWCNVRLFRKNKARWQPWQILTALEYVHSLRLIHCDLKPARAPVFGCGLMWIDVDRCGLMWIDVFFFSWRNWRTSKILHSTFEENILIKSYSRCEVKAYQTDTWRPDVSSFASHAVMRVLENSRFMITVAYYSITAYYWAGCYMLVRQWRVVWSCSICLFDSHWTHFDNTYWTQVIDFGSSCFVDDHLSSYVQSRSYRAPEVRPVDLDRTLSQTKNPAVYLDVFSIDLA